jgi:transglutaminase/protease-like cytokinesis protein 3
MKVEYRLSPDKAAAWRQMAASVKAPENMSYLRKVRWIHDWICKRCTPIPQYANTAGHNGYEAIVNRKGVCEGYAVLFKAICDANGITSRFVLGSLDKKYDHAWNAVLYEGEWYFVDVYWDDEAWTMSKSPKTTYFMYGAKSKQYRQHHDLDAMESRKLNGYCIANSKKAKETV